MTECCATAVVAATESDRARISDLTAQLASSQPEPVKVARAERDQALEYLSRMLKRIEKQGGYATSTQQADVRGARAFLAEMGWR